MLKMETLERMDSPRSKGCVTQAAKQLALPPNQNGYRRLWRSRLFLRAAAASGVLTAETDMLVIDLVSAFRVA
jgi:hypothetical protein